MTDSTLQGQINLLTGEVETALNPTESAADMRGSVIRFLLTLPGGVGRTVKEIAGEVQLPHMVVRQRVMELKAAGLIAECVNRQRQASGEWSPLWKATARARLLQNTPNKE